MSTIKVTNLRHESATGDNITLTSTDRVGIGTSSPAVTVHAEDAQCELQLKSTSGSNIAGIRMVPGGQTNALYMYADGSRNITFDDHATTLISIRSGGGITFNGDTAAANALDDYEEGTWTPTQGSFSTWTSPTFNATYTKVGRLVTVVLYQTGGTVGWSAQQRMDGLPFTPSTPSTGYFTDNFPDQNGGILVWTNSGLYFASASASETEITVRASYFTNS